MAATTDATIQAMLDRAAGEGIDLAWDRYQKQLPQCGFGELGLCCRHCLQGPCRIDPFGQGPALGVCGADRDTMAARGLGRAVAAGTAAHGGHAKHMAHTLLAAAQGKAPDYPIRDEAKLRRVAARLGIATEGREAAAVAAEVARAALAEFSEKETPLAWAAGTVTPGRVATFARHGVVPCGIDSTVSEMMHRTTYGVDADPVNLLLGAVKCALADYAACHLATDLADILFGTPSPVATRANLGVLKASAVNIALHGHNPLLSDLVAQVAGDPALVAQAQAAGAADGINVVGICCTGNEIMVRHGIPLATSSVSQETALVTGAVDALVVDYQCVMPSLASVADCFHTRVITTMPMAKLPRALHLELTEGEARATAFRIVGEAIAAFRQRNPARVQIPDGSVAAVAGFSAEAIVGALALLDQDDPLKPLVDNIAAGNIYGVCLFAGCNTVKVPQDANYTRMIEILAGHNVLILATGCASGAFARHGFMSPAATDRYAGDGLKAVLTAVGQAAGLGGPLPLVLHMGSCVDNSRAADVAVAVANRLGVDLDRLPLVASAPEPVTEKAVAIGTWAMAAGIPTHLGVAPPVLGSPAVTRVLTATVKDLFGGWLLVEPDPEKAAQALLAVLAERRQGLGLSA
ncbi:MAG: anaerobic carbon-monoxide dehydrogenase catalytic subunit [Thermodesulfobacteriota bacterium]